MARTQEWLARWEAKHTVPAKDVLLSLLSRGVDLDRVCFEFDADARAIRHWCKQLNVKAPRRVIQLSPEERQRRSEAAKTQLSARPRTRADLTVDGETLPRYEWYKRYGGSAGGYYNENDEEAVKYVLDRKAALASGVITVRRTYRSSGQRTNNSEMRKRMQAALPYARAAVAGLDEGAIRAMVRAEIEKLAKAKVVSDEQKAPEESPGRTGDEG